TSTRNDDAVGLREREHEPGGDDDRGPDRRPVPRSGDGRGPSYRVLVQSLEHLGFAVGRVLARSPPDRPVQSARGSAPRRDFAPRAELELGAVTQAHLRDGRPRQVDDAQQVVQTYAGVARLDARRDLEYPDDP